MSQCNVPKRTIKSQTRLMDNIRKKELERKRNILHLILGYLNEHNLQSTAEALQIEAQLDNQYQISENIDLDIILQEYQAFYYTKFQKYPKILRKITEPLNLPNHPRKPEPRKTSAKQKENHLCNKEENSDGIDFQFEIISLIPDENVASDAELVKQPLCNFKNYSSEWREMADEIIRNFIPKTPGLNWNDCIGLQTTIECLKEATIYPGQYPDLFKELQHASWKGVLLYGPPGTGKTLLAKTLACESHTTFINVTSSTFISKWRGESEKMIKVLFDVAKYYAPCTIFIDELDALLSANSATTGEHEASRRFKSELLTQIDGILQCDASVFVLATTNTPWNIDKAMLRRFEKRIFVALPTDHERSMIFAHYLKELKYDITPEDFKKFGKLTENFSGSDIKTVCKEVSMVLIREKLNEIKTKSYNKNIAVRKIKSYDIEMAIQRVKPCNNIHDCNKYCEWTIAYGSF